MKYARNPIYLFLKIDFLKINIKTVIPIITATIAIAIISSRDWVIDEGGEGAASFRSQSAPSFVPIIAYPPSSVWVMGLPKSSIIFPTNELTYNG
jgi:hypothetical protein